MTTPTTAAATIPERLAATTRDLREMARRPATALHNPGGVLTAELLRQPGRFGLGQTVADRLPDAIAKSVCGYCSTGCNLTVSLREGQVVGLQPTTEYPVNLGMACPKGWEALEVLKADDRARVPLFRPDPCGNPGDVRPLDWDEALDLFCGRFAAIQNAYGLDSVAFLSTGQIATEEMALLGVLAKFGMGMVHGDGNTRQCMATAVVAYKQAFGFDAPPYTYADFEQSDTLVFWGANPCLAHPIMWERVMRNRFRDSPSVHGRGPAIVAIDPRRTETAMQATQHLPLAPKSDLVLAYTLGKLLIDRGAVDEAFVAEHTSGYEQYAAHVANFPVERAAEATGLPAEQIERLADTLARGSAVSHWWTMGVNQSYEGTRLAQAIIALALMTRNIGRPGTGANSITGQCNAMGSRLFSNTTNLLGGRDFTDPADRRTVAERLAIDEARIPREPSLPYHRILEEVEAGRIRGLWVIATNPAHSWINQHRLERLREKLDFLVVQDMYASTETAAIADLVLPAAGWGEKDGTFINSERRIGRHRKVAAAPGQALADFHIFRLIADRWGCGDLVREWTDPEAAFGILQRLSADTPCDFTGIAGYADLEAAGGVQWPAPPLAEGETRDTERRLFADGQFFHDDGRARFLVDEPQTRPEPTDEAYPLTLLTGRGSASQWHTQTRTSKSAVLRKLYPASPYVEIHPEDAATAGIAMNDWVEVASRRGSVKVRALVTPTVGQGRVFVPMHDATTNRLTLDRFDPHSHQPSYKACAVRVSLAHSHATDRPRPAAAPPTSLEAT